MTRDGFILRKLAGRLKSARASVMFEFAMMAPLVVVVAVFAADFTRILRTEQQLEIAARLGADVEAHMADYYASGESPTSTAKEIAKSYLVNLAQVQTNTAHIYMKGDVQVVGNPFSSMIDYVTKTLKGEGFGKDNWFLKMIFQVVGGVFNFLTFGTLNYITDVVPHDRQVRVSVAAYIPTILPAAAYEWLGLAHHDRRHTGNAKTSPDLIGVGQFAYDLEGNGWTTFAGLTLNPGARHRVYCVMPVMDSVPIAPETYVRVIWSWIAPIVKAFGFDI